MAIADSTYLAGLLSMNEAARFTNTHPNTLRKYSNLGRLPAYRVLGGQRRFKRDDLAEFFGLENTKENVSDGASKILAYCRCSSDGQKESLGRQIERVKEFCLDQYRVEPLLFSEIGSALNYRRKKLNELLRGILAGKFDGSILVIEYKDRGMRFAFELLELICQVHNVKIVIIENNDNLSEAEELQQDLLSIITIFSNRNSAAKSRKILEKHIDQKAIQRIHELRRGGMAINRISEVMQAENYKTTKGGFVTVGLVRKYLKERPTLDAGGNNSIQAYYLECIEQCGEDYRISKQAVYDHYVKWCKNNGIKNVTMAMAGRILHAVGFKECVIHPTPNKTLLAWQSIKIKNEKLEIRVVPKGAYRVRQTQVKKDNFHRFYDEVLKGRWAGIRSELNESYRIWAELNGVKPLNTRKVTLIIESLGYTPMARGKGHIFDFTNPPKTTNSSCIIAANAANSALGRECEVGACWPLIF